MYLADLAWPAVAALPKDTPVVFPVAALEQHGHHMPVFTDSLLCGEIVRRAEERLRDRVLVAPLQWLGNSDHHLDFAGTLSAPPRLYLDLLGGLIETMRSDSGLLPRDALAAMEAYRSRYGSAQV